MMIAAFALVGSSQAWLACWRSAHSCSDGDSRDLDEICVPRPAAKISGHEGRKLKIGIDRHIYSLSTYTRHSMHYAAQQSAR